MAGQPTSGIHVPIVFVVVVVGSCPSLLNKWKMSRFQPENRRQLEIRRDTIEFIEFIEFVGFIVETQ